MTFCLCTAQHALLFNKVNESWLSRSWHNMVPPESFDMYVFCDRWLRETCLVCESYFTLNSIDMSWIYASSNCESSLLGNAVPVAWRQSSANA